MSKHAGVSSGFGTNLLGPLHEDPTHEFVTLSRRSTFGARVSWPLRQVLAWSKQPVFDDRSLTT